MLYFHTGDIYMHGFGYSLFTVNMREQVVECKTELRDGPSDKGSAGGIVKYPSSILGHTQEKPRDDLKLRSSTRARQIVKRSRVLTANAARSVAATSGKGSRQFS